ncbi:putative bifunctional diguanylate cyclase/phosphodiesterase [Mangrovitalea sediminis]|uniref:putative bifunctional diguanylate cyclase/phosphodiesterase n=1 Tax=Mangrovitalea sediminis TaxID=1982043 RepID=UPI000BE5B31C|nr:EAL domain-containing protein [Mangrovitalea sediminis]
MVSISEQPQLFHHICELSAEALMVTQEDLSIVYVNAAFEATTGYHSKEVQGQRPSLLSSGYHGPEFYQRMWKTIEQRGRWQGLVWNRRKDGQVYPEWLNIIRVQEGQATYYAGQFSDLSAFENIRSDLRRFACYDHLTELPNRALFEDLVRARLRQSVRQNRPCALLFVDIDHFKQFNDVYGHPYGDNVIRAVAQRLSSTLRDSDVVARFAGDEFVVLLDDCAESSSLGDLCKRMTQAFETPLMIEGEPRYISVTIGAARHPEDGSDVETLIRNADIALYAAKESGRGQARYFSPDLFAPILRANLVATTLRQELERTPKAFSAVYQPQFDLASQQRIGMEVLLRWHSPVLGIVSPAEFIPIAENHSLIQPLTLRLVEAVMRDIAGAPTDIFSRHRLCLNVSALQIPNAILLPVLEPLQQRCVALGMDIELEITETQLMRQSEKFPQGLRDLRQAGYSIAIDDFGTGYSALGYLRRLPVDTLKIDRCFIRELDRNVQDAAIIKAIVAMARGLDLRVVAEGIENAQQCRQLSTDGCDVGQGFWLSHPLPFADLLTAPHLAQPIGNPTVNNDEQFVK